MIFQKLKNLFKYEHGYTKNCTGKNFKKCPVCSTPWPKKNETPTEKYLKSINYYDKYEFIYFPPNNGDGLEHVGGIFYGGYLNLPKGMKGNELLEIALKLKSEYNLITKNTAEEEVRKRGAL